MEGFLTPGNIIQVVVYTVTVISIVWKMTIDITKVNARMKMDIANINLKIEELKEDRNQKWKEQNDKWACHDEKQSKSDDKYEALLAVMNEVRVEVGKINTTISFLKEK